LAFALTLKQPILCTVLWLSLKLLRQKRAFFVDLNLKQLKEVIDDFERRIELREGDDDIDLRTYRAPTVQVLQKDSETRDQNTDTDVVPVSPTDHHREAMAETLSATGTAHEGASHDQLARRSSLSVDDMDIPTNTSWRLRVGRL
jgi:hypothetical protein